jgi:F-type H+-transporting ATPase subunit delta
MRVTAKQYAQILFNLTDGKSKPEIEKSLVGFARYLHKERKMKLAGKIIESFGKIYNEENGIVEAEIATVEKISTDTEKKIKDYLEKKYRVEKVFLKNAVNKKIKGGFVLKVGDEIIDGSVNGKLKELKNILVG